MGMPIESKLNGIIKKKFPKTKKIILSNGGSHWLHAVAQISKTSSTNVKKYN